MVDALALRAPRSSTASPSSAGSRKSSRLSASATTIADLPSGVKYMLYGSSTTMVLPGLPVVGSIGVRLPSVPALRVVGHPERLQVPRGHHVLRVDADREAVHHLHGGGIDHGTRRCPAGWARRRAAARPRPPGSSCPTGSRCRGWRDPAPAACPARSRRGARPARRPSPGPQADDRSDPSAAWQSSRVVSSAMRDGFPDRVHGPAHDQLDARPAQLGGGAGRVAVHPVARARRARRRSARTRRGSVASISEVSASPAWRPSSASV